MKFKIQILALATVLSPAALIGQQAPLSPAEPVLPVLEAPDAPDAPELPVLGELPATPAAPELPEAAPAPAAPVAPIAESVPAPAPVPAPPHEVEAPPVPEAPAAAPDVRQSRVLNLPGIRLRMTRDADPDSKKVEVGSPAFAKRRARRNDDADRDDKPSHDPVRTEWAFLDIGINVPMANGGFDLPEEAAPFEDLRYGRSMHLDFEVVRQRIMTRGEHFGLDYGLAFSWYNYAFQQDVILTPDAPEFSYNISEEPLRKSKISATYLSVPVLLHVESNPDNKSRSFRFSAGMQGGIRIASKTKVKTTNKSKTKTKDDYNLADFRYGPVVRIGYGWLNFFAEYNLSPFFEEGQGPEMHSASAGLSMRVF